MNIMIKYKINLNNILNHNNKLLKLFILKFKIKLLHKFMNLNSKKYNKIKINNYSKNKNKKENNNKKNNLTLINSMI